MLFSKVDSDEPYSAIPMEQIRLISWLSPEPRLSLRTTRAKIPEVEDSANSCSGNVKNTTKNSPLPIDDKLVKYAEHIVERYDHNKDGVIETDEWDKLLMSPLAADANRDGKITQTEYAEWMRARSSR